MSQPAFRPTLILSAFALLALPLSAAAQEEPRGASFELFGGASSAYSRGSGRSDLTLHAESFGVRGGFHLTDVWSLEAELSRSSHDGPAYDGEVSAKAYLFQTDRFRLFGLAGAGLHHEDASGRSNDSSTVHAGIGAEIGLSAKTYFRPEIRARWPTSHPNGDNRVLEATVGFGWRF